ncbi:Cytochrome P450 [Emericellopsis cladophorae]|uniref:Cytochrome P450 n=1 Tax=Emericellopsis cladophorae TaxID=2686198 RepID=A0A9P9XU47_9HYPO|nr:Cytochrome P450 [Emericellopsis cladophorae]KAI6777585.1 Cytochrome P450 [Emericellopsis cladophorae]
MASYAAQWTRFIAAALLPVYWIWSYASWYYGYRKARKNEPDNIHAILATKFADFEIGSRRRDNAAELLGSGIIVADGPSWKHGPALIRPYFARKQLTHLGIVERHIQTLFGAFPDNDSPFDIQERIFRLTFEVGTDLLFGHSDDGRLLSDPTELAQEFAWAFDRSLEGVAARMRMGKAARFYYGPGYLPACKSVHAYIRTLLDEAERVDKTRQAKLRREIDETLRGRQPTYEDIKSMVYLGRIVRETLRMYPPIPFNGRVAVCDTVLPRGGGPDGKAPIYVQKGRQIAYSVFPMHRRADLWGSDADEFQPDRWETARPRFAYLPFSAGPRICPGQHFATIESSYFLTRLLQRERG